MRYALYEFACQEGQLAGNTQTETGWHLAPVNTVASAGQGAQARTEEVVPLQQEERVRLPLCFKACCTVVD